MDLGSKRINGDFTDDIVHPCFLLLELGDHPDKKGKVECGHGDISHDGDRILKGPTEDRDS